MERKELSNNNRELWRESNSDARNKDIPGYNSVPTTGVLRIPDHWEGYECLLSDDLFTVLALDVWRYEEYDDELVKQHYEEISRFLSNLIQLKDGGIEFHDQYPKLNMELANKRVKEAFASLDTASKRVKYFNELLEEKKRWGRERLEPLINAIMADNRVTVEESLQFIEEATTLHLTEAEAAGILLEAILKQGFKPSKPLNQNLSNHSKLLSTEFERVSSISSINQQASSIPTANSSSLLSVEDLLDSGMLEEYIAGGGRTEGKEWVEFYKSLKADFNIGSISELKSLIEVKKPTFIESKLVEMIEVEGGTFLMGATPEQGEEAEDAERPVHRVTLSSYLIGKYPVTQALWESITGSNPSKFKGPNRPVEQVSWFEAVEFCNKLSEKEGLQIAYSGSGDNIICDFNANGYRLPTEVEWEYAAREGNQSRGYKYSGSNDLDAVGWYDDNSGGETKEVGKKQPNELGIHDMSGNVWEWCWDWYGDYSSSSQTDSRGPNSGSRRVVRGGGWYNGAGYCRVARRGRFNPDYEFSALGFRLVRTR
ncbi:MAG: hypothetical protein HBSAPP04_02630 [Ignavibacteriaceae bacterium]|nr:MAG: hypothetical protein HBSAPP04_02630 [Ignavibacteriaceae bacterium]